MHTIDIKNRNLNINQANNWTCDTASEVCIKLLNYEWCFWDTFWEYSPLNSKLTIKLDEVCDWKSSESNHHKQLIISYQKGQRNYNAT